MHINLFVDHKTLITLRYYIYHDYNISIDLNYTVPCYILIQQVHPWQCIIHVFILQDILNNDTMIETMAKTSFLE